ncbi:hypothetical protein FRZ54_07245 [Mucilaginibacter ginsenosidivorans]|uniref:PAS fold-4 domain-containing protein n=2 Tax=Mucilaginibacter ginsenosidivorans TaxID=398053 RepID=A0A5B8UTF7_9SPHI|nr:hypothetical protein FRZ54_07245 [Mucilaginibacter ginsenosidivorans]
MGKPLQRGKVPFYFFKIMCLNYLSRRMFVKSSFAEHGLDIQSISSPLLSYWDKELVCRFANEAYAAAAGIVLERLTGNRMSTIASAVQIPDNNYVRKVLQGKMQLFIIGGTSQSRKNRGVIASYSPVYGNGEVEGFYFHAAETGRPGTEPAAGLAIRPGR